MNTLYKISETNENLEKILAVFKIRLLSIVGFRPHIENCQCCKKRENLQYFSLLESGFKCSECAKQDKSTIEISETTINAVRYIVLSDAKKIFSFEISKEAEKELEIVAKLYLVEKLEKEYKI